MRNVALLVSILAMCAGAQAKGVRVSFDPADPATGPFPTDYLTVPDEHQKTGLRVNLPLPSDCTAMSPVAGPICTEIGIINGFDGFAVQPRLHVRFSGPINPDTLRDGIYILWLDKLTDDEYGMGPTGHISLINEVVYDPATNTACAKPDDALDQTRRYAVIVTSAVRDTEGDPVEAPDTSAFCAANADYCRRLTEAVQVAGQITRPPLQVIGASVFTTMTVTAFMERARLALQTINPSFSRTGTKNVFTASDIQGITLHQQVRTASNKFKDTSLPVPAALLAQVGLGRVAFGSYHTGRFVGPSFAITPPGTADPVPVPTQDEEIFFHVYMPVKPAPAGGYPVAIVGHGFGGTRLDVPTAMIPGLVGSGFAVIGINALGHGGGPEGTLIITERNGTATTFPFGGRGADLNGDGNIEDGEGAVFFTAQQPIGIRDALRQTALDLSQLTRALQMGMDLDGDGIVDLSQTEITYLGVSLGSYYGSLLNAIEPAVTSAVLNVGGGTAILPAIFSPSFRDLMRHFLGDRPESLLNKGDDFDANLPLRYEPVRVNQVPGAMAIQDEIERLEWIETPGAPHAFAPHFKSTTLPGVPIKRTLFQFAVGDMTVTNPANVQLLRMANMWDTAVMYRYDLARDAFASLPANPHAFIAQIDSPIGLAIGVTAQVQAAQFLLGTDWTVPQVPANFQQFFEPATHRLEFLNFAVTQ